MTVTVTATMTTLIALNCRRSLGNSSLVSYSECDGDEDCHNSDRVKTKDLHGHHDHGDHHHHHHHHDDSPEHRDCPKLCPLIFRPVCGSDGM